jgi:hypothetical protein
VSTPATKPIEPVVPATPRPIADFNDSGLRESIQKALEGVPANHANALLNIDHNGIGLMLVGRHKSPNRPEEWALVVATRYSFKEGPSAQVGVQVSWPDRWPDNE